MPGIVVGRVVVIQEGTPTPAGGEVVPYRKTVFERWEQRPRTSVSMQIIFPDGRIVFEA